jgi:hypothetical protein
LETPSIQPEPCPIRRRLVADLEAVHARVAELNDRDVQCIMNADLAGSDALVDQLAEARAQRERAIDAIRQHTAAHECQRSVAAE